MARAKVTGTRPMLMWGILLVIVILLLGLAIGLLVVYPNYQSQQAAARATAQAQAQLEQHYRAGVAFQNVGDWDAAEAEYKQVILVDAGYKDVQARMAEVKGRASAIQATATAAAMTQAVQVQKDAQATVVAAPTATAEALEIHYQKGVGYLSVGRYQDAKAELEQVFALSPNYKDVQTRLKMVDAEIAKAVTPISAPTSTPRPFPTPKQDFTYTLNANDSTGLRISVRAGDRLTINATGRVHTFPNGTVADCDYWIGPNGIDSCHYVREDPRLHGLPFMALIARVDGNWILIGEQRSVVTTKDQDIWLMINDWDFSDSRGNFTVHVTVD